MKYSLNNYVDAFSQLVEKVPDVKAIEGFVRLLKKTGDIKNASKIIEAVHKKLLQDKGGRWINIETARELSAENSKELKNKFSAKDHLVFNVNPELVAGVRVTINGEEELDNSLTNKLNKMFK